MATESSDEDMENWVFYLDRDEWKDVVPIEQDDGPFPVVAIAYTEKCKSLNNHTRFFFYICHFEPVLLFCHTRGYYISYSHFPPVEGQQFQRGSILRGSRQISVNCFTKRGKTLTLFHRALCFQRG